MKRIAIFSNDAGASDILLELLSANKEKADFRLFCTQESPCYALTQAKNLSNYTTLVLGESSSISQALQLFAPEIIFYGTGWQNHFEYHVLDYSKKHHIPSVAFLDNWTNYRERFSYPKPNWKNNLPDFIALHDETSMHLASSLDLPNLLPVTNYALNKQLKEAKSLNIKEEESLLFLTEPTAKVAQKSFGNAKYWGFDETSVFQEIKKHFDYFTCNTLTLRIHPSDTKDVYKKIDPDVTFSTTSLLEDLAKAKIIIGIDTVALRLGYLLGKKVIAFIPSSKRDFCVPIPKENQVRSLKNLDINQIKTAQKDEQNFGMDFASLLQKLIGS